MKRTKIEIRGISPVIWNRMKKELVDEIKSCKKDQLAAWEEANWRRKAEYDSKNNLLIPPEWIKSALCDACKKTRIVPHFATSKQQTYTYYFQSSMVEVTEPVGKVSDLEPYGCFVGARGKNSDTKTWRVRPLLRNWKATFIWTDADGRISDDELRTILEHAGLMTGIGDNRINNFGRFEVVNISEVKK
jgi:hypothetical protein